MDKEQWMSKLEEKGREETIRRRLIEKAKELKDEQEGIHTDFVKLFEHLLTEEEREKRQSSLSIVIDKDYTDLNLGKGIITAHLAAIKGHLSQRADDFNDAHGFLAELEFTPNEKSLQGYVTGPEFFPKGERGEHQEITPWHAHGALTLEQAKKIVAKMEEQIVATDLRQRADETLSLLLKAAYDEGLNPELAENLRKSDEKAALPEGH